MSKILVIETEAREHIVKRSISEMGRSAAYFDCPFCGEEVKGYYWSLAGSGKRCRCGAFPKIGVTYRGDSKS